MIDTVTFENESGAVLRPMEDLGLFLVEYDAPPPAPKLYRVSLDGADGQVDLSEWAGEIRYNTRTVTAKFRDLEGRGFRELTQFLHGRRVKLTFSPEPDFYYYGRCDAAAEATRRRVTNQTFTFTCEPYMLAHAPTVIRRQVGSGARILLAARRKSAIPQITVTDACTLEYGGNTYALTPGTHTVPTLIVTDKPQMLAVSGAGTITLQWRDGML